MYLLYKLVMAVATVIYLVVAAAFVGIYEVLRLLFGPLVRGSDDR